MKNYYYLFISLILCSCASTWKTMLINEGDEHEAIINAIIDFSNTSKLKKEDKIFSVQTYINEKDFWGISFFGQDGNKVYPGPEDKIGVYTDRFPTRYIEKDGKLYYWFDANYYISEEIVEVLSKYNYIDSTYINGFNGIIPSYISDDSKKGVDYYICKNNLRNYKKVTTNRAMGWYKAPKLKCESKKKK